MFWPKLQRVLVRHSSGNRKRVGFQSCTADRLPYPSDIRCASIKKVREVKMVAGACAVKLSLIYGGGLYGPSERVAK